MSDSFTCATCGGTHDGPIMDWAFKLPDVVWDIPQSERSERADFNSDLCEFGDRRFIRGILFVPLTHSDREFGWGAWAEVERGVYDRYVDAFKEDGSRDPLQLGTLANELPVYDSSLGTPLVIRFRDAKSRPLFVAHESVDSLLANEQREGIDEARYSEILHLLSDRKAKTRPRT